MKIKVGIVGYGTIGKRVADAVLLQEDMELIGITAKSYNYKITSAKSKQIPIYSLDDPRELEKNGINIIGNLNDLLAKVDVVVDCSPKPYGKANREIYKKAGVKAIFQGGEKADIGFSFVAQCNYDKAKGEDFIRVVSCNTTGLGRTLNAIDKMYGVAVARATLIRRGSDPVDSSRGPINAIVPSLELPSHHGPDVRTVLPHIDVFTTAVIVPTTLMHMHNVSVKVKKTPSKDEMIKKFNEISRIRVISSNSKIKSTAQILEFSKDLGYNRGDMMEICVWEDGLGVYGSEIFFMQAIHQESDVVPENIDAIRAAIGECDAYESIMRTDKSLRLDNKQIITKNSFDEY